MKEIITMEVIKITTMGSFDPLIQLVTPFAEDALLSFRQWQYYLLQLWVYIIN